MGFPNIYELFYLFTMIKAVGPVTRGIPIQDQLACDLDPCENNDQRGCEGYLPEHLKK